MTDPKPRNRLFTRSGALTVAAVAVLLSVLLPILMNLNKGSSGDIDKRVHGINRADAIVQLPHPERERMELSLCERRLKEIEDSPQLLWLYDGSDVFDEYITDELKRLESVALEAPPADVPDTPFARMMTGGGQTAERQKSLIVELRDHFRRKPDVDKQELDRQRREAVIALYRDRIERLKAELAK